LRRRTAQTENSSAQPVPTAAGTTVARSSYLSPLQPARPVERVQTLREALHRAEQGPGSKSPLPTALHSPLPAERPCPLTPRKTAQHGADCGTTPLQTPRSDAMRRLVEAASRGAQSPGLHVSPLMGSSPFQRQMRQAPFAGRSPAVKRPAQSALETPPSTKPRRTLAATLPSACLTDLQPRAKRGAFSLGLSAGASPAAHGALLASASEVAPSLEPLSGGGARGARGAFGAAPAGRASLGPRRSLRAQLDDPSLMTSSLLRHDPGLSEFERSAAAYAGAAKQQSVYATAARADVHVVHCAAPPAAEPAATDDTHSPMDTDPAPPTSSAAIAPPLAAEVSTSALPPRPHHAASKRHARASTSQLADAVRDSAARTAVRASGGSVASAAAAGHERSRSPPARPPRINVGRPRRPPTHNRVPQALSRTPSLTGQAPPYRSVTPAAASPTHSVSTPAGLAPPPLQMPGAPMKMSREEAAELDFVGRISSLSIDDAEDAGGFPLRAGSVHGSPPRADRGAATRRMLVFDDLPAGGTP
jgi:hypothetical protein